MERPEQKETALSHAARLLALLELERRYYQELFITFPIPAAVFSASGQLVLLNREFRDRFGIEESDVGRLQYGGLFPGLEAGAKAKEVLDTGTPLTGWRVDIPSVSGTRASTVSLLRTQNWELGQAELLVMVQDAPATVKPAGRSIAAAVAAAVAQGPAAAMPVRRHAEDLDVLFWEMDRKTLRFRGVGARALELTGVRREDWTTAAEFCQNYVHPLDRQAYLDFYSQDLFIRGGGSLEYRVLPTKGPARWLRDVVRPAGEETGRQDSLAGLTEDFSDRRRLEADRVEAGKRAALERLAGRIAHVSNNLLMIIGGYGEELQASFQPDDPRRSDIDEILKASERLANLTRQLTELSRPAAAEENSLELNEWAAGYAVRLRQRIEGDQEVDFLPARKAVTVSVPGALLERFLDNALYTARPALPPYGRIMLEVVPGRGGAPAQLTLRFGGADFDGDVRERFFEPFSGPKAGAQDPPLGVAGDIRPLSAYGVRTRLEGEPGEDPRLVVYMPQIEEAPAPQAAVAAAAVGAGAATILLVEDEASIRSLVRKSLRREGYEVVDAGTTEDGIATARNVAGRIDLLITDVMVPLINGRALAEEIVRQHPAVKILFISGYSDDAVLESGTLPAGAAYLRKPFTLGAMLEKVRELLSGQSRAAGMV